MLDKGARLDYKYPTSGLTHALFAIVRGKPKLLNLLLEYGASMDYVVNGKVVQDHIKTCPYEIEQVHFKHQRWRRLRDYLKLFTNLNGVIDQEH